MLGFSSIMDFFGLGDITGIDVFFAAMAVIGTVLFTIYFLLVLVGGVADGFLDAIPDWTSIWRWTQKACSTCSPSKGC